MRPLSAFSKALAENAAQSVARLWALNPTIGRWCEELQGGSPGSPNIANGDPPRKRGSP